MIDAPFFQVAIKWLLFVRIPFQHISHRDLKWKNFENWLIQLVVIMSNFFKDFKCGNNTCVNNVIVSNLHEVALKAIQKITTDMSKQNFAELT